jgi:transcriptional regulator with XRE-family HTH domain
MNERLKKLRKALNLTQQKFGERLGIKGNTVAQYELGRNLPIEPVVNLICLEFNVNEEWLRTGEGDMFLPVEQDADIEKLARLLAREEDSSFKKQFVSMFVSKLESLSDEQWEDFERFVKQLAETKQD